ncbi:hypothetical protein [Thiothrix sp.]|uniref:hypothetical protein n=1 Tax=Thiothrix sp. TaxID=1032 RepID=UPI00257AEA91|nr:hypothetical protein [Thiothrix sp.]
MRYSNIPLAGWALDAVSTARAKSKTSALASLLADPDAAIAALNQQAKASQYSPAIGRAGVAGGGVLSALLRDHSAGEEARR